jgi:hypothetical protein
VGATGTCKQKVRLFHTLENHTCDPPEGFVNSSNEEINANTQGNEKLTLLDLLINPFPIF